MAKIDTVAYRLELPPRARIHDVFHVGVPKKYHGPAPEGPLVLPPLFQGHVHPTPIKDLCARIAQGVQPVLTQWDGQPTSVMSTHASVLVDSVGPPSAEVCRTAASFP
jgi:hypothetical protein